MADTINLGIVTAYGAAVEGGYTGTYEEFCAAEANFANIAANITEALEAKADKVSNATNGNIAALDANGNLTDSGIPSVTTLTSTDPYTYRQGKGNLADMEIVGASVGWNQLARPFGTTYYNQTNIASISYTDNVATFTANAQDGRVYLGTDYRPAIYSSHVYFASVKVKPSTSTDRIQLLVAGTAKAMPVESTNWTEITMIMSPSSDSNSPVIGVRDHRTSGWDSVQAKELVFIDLTLLFGSTVADAIYAMETATAGAGEAFFRKYFPKDYYAYDAGSIQSVCVGSRKVTGKNLFNISNLYTSVEVAGDTFNVIGGGYNKDFFTGTTGSSTNVSSSYFGKLPYLKAGTYSVSYKQGAGVRILYVNPDGSVEDANNDVTVTSGQSFTLTRDSMITIRRNVNVATTYTQFQLEIGTTATAYEPYTSTAYPFDSTKQLCGMFSLVGGELKANGDVWRGDKIQRNWLEPVDLGTLDWTYQNELFYFVGTSIGAKSKGLGICTKYTYKGTNSELLTGDKQFIIGTNNIVFRDYSYTDAATFKTAMSGVYLLAQRATPTTESAQPYQNPQRAYIDGTEEFTDGLTRDVMIPVGNNTTYQQDKILPSVEDYVDAVADSIIPKLDINPSSTIISNYPNGAVWINSSASEFGLNTKINNVAKNIFTKVMMELPYEFSDGAAAINNGSQYLDSGEYSKKIHIFGGSGSGNETKHYEWDGKNWTQGLTLPYNFVKGAAVYSDQGAGRIFILGGQNSKTKMSSLYIDDSGLDDDEWDEDWPELPYEFYDGSAVVLGEEIHILGGNNNERSHYKYNESNETWTEVSELPCDLYTSNGAVILNGEIYIIDSAGSGFAKWDGTNWTELPNAPGSVDAPLLAVLNNEIHYLGAGPSNNQHLKWNGVSWEFITTIPIRNVRSGSVVTLNNEIYVMGSFSSYENRKFYKYDGKVWKNVELLY